MRKKNFRIILYFCVKNGGNSCNKSIWSKSKKYSNCIPFDYRFCTTCLLWISSGKDIKITSNKDGNSRNKWNNKYEKSRNFFEKLCYRCTSTSYIRRRLIHWIKLYKIYCKIRIRYQIWICKEGNRKKQRHDATNHDGVNNFLHNIRFSFMIADSRKKSKNLQKWLFFIW